MLEFNLLDTVVTVMGTTASANGFQAPKIPDRVTNLDMGKMAISEQGDTSIYSGGFAGCLGLVIVPFNKKGGAVSHIHQMWPNKGYEANYFFGAASRSIDKAQETWGVSGVGVVLFRGQKNGMTLWYPKLKDSIETKANVIKVIDCRQDGGAEGDQVFYDTGEKRIYIFSGSLAGLIDKIDDHPAKAESSIDIVHARRTSMKVLCYS